MVEALRLEQYSQDIYSKVIQWFKDVREAIRYEGCI